jgi:peptidoglycan/xylan/chitin deacetylase (PgdA/CDA1 family)
VRDAKTDAAWSALHPDAQAAWQSKERFVSFYKRKFGPIHITSFQIGDPSAIGPWSDAIAGLSYPAAVTVPVSLTIAQGAGHEDRTLAGRPIVVVDNGTRWVVAQTGVAGPDGEIILPSALPSRVATIPILMYHHVAPRPTRAQFRTDYDFRLADSLTVSPDDFAQQLDSLSADGYHTVTPHAVLNALLYDTPLPDNPIALTFDDGYLDNYTYAMPPLRQHHMIATFNVIVAKIGTSSPDLQYMSWDNLNELVALGMDVQSHTMTHPDLGTLSDDAALHELVDSRAALRDHLHIGIDFITYPSGEPFRSGSVARQQRLLRLVAAAGYAGGLLAPRVSSTSLDARRPFELMRVRVSGGEAIKEFLQSLGTPGGNGDPIRDAPGPASPPRRK